MTYMALKAARFSSKKDSSIVKNLQFHGKYSESKKSIKDEQNKKEEQNTASIDLLTWVELLWLMDSEILQMLILQGFLQAKLLDHLP